MSEELARQRFMILNIMRFGAILIVALGIAIIGGKIPVQPTAGYFVLVVGAIDFFIVPRLLKRAWQKQDQ
jgi:hypothetical protein